MKTSTILAVASAQIVSATFGWNHARPFKCPSNTDNVCIPSQSGGFNWESLDLGDFSSFGGFDFSGFACASSFDKSKKRDVLTGRTFQDKCITGSAHHDVKKAPKFGCGSSKDVNAFSVSEFQISVEFDTELEFHYGMSDGSTCKQKSRCRKGGSQIKNSQCGGAKSVTVVYPTPTGKGPKSTCSFGVHSISFDCSKSSTSVSRTKTKTPKTTTTKATSETKETTTTTKETKPASSPATTTNVDSTVTSPTAVAQTTTPLSIESTTQESSTSTQTVQSTTSETPSITTESPSTTSETPSTTSETPSTTSQSVITTPGIPVLTTSTIFTTLVSTIVSCAPTVPNCPAQSTALTTVTVAISTTVCEVTETPNTAVPSPSIEVPTTFSVATTSAIVPEGSAPPSSPASPTTVAPPPPPPAESAVQSSTTVIVVTAETLCPVTVTHTTAGTTSLEITSSISTVVFTTSITAGPSTLTTSSTAPPATDAPCPEILPKCLSTWMFTIGCTDNTDTECYCPSSEFVSTIFACLAAHGASGDEVSQAQTYFQGICAPQIPSNPAIVTGATPVTGPSGALITAPPVGPLTTLEILTTIVVPVIESTGISAGSIIPSSSVTTTISSVLTVPQVVFSTITAAAGEQSAALVVGVPSAVKAETTDAVANGSSPTGTAVGRPGASATGKPGPLQVGANAASRGKIATGSLLGAVVAAVLFF